MEPMPALGGGLQKATNGNLFDGDRGEGSPSKEVVGSKRARHEGWEAYTKKKGGSPAKPQRKEVVSIGWAFDLNKRIRRLSIEWI
jgi:hypothetical protein